LLINRYLSREIFTPVVTICAILVLIFAGYSTTRYLPDAANGLMTGNTVLVLVLLKILIALEVLIPVTLFLSVITVLGRLHAGSEIIAMQACGLGEKSLLKTVFYMSFLIATIVAALSLYARPWAYEKSYWLKAEAEANFDLSRLRSGRFHEVGESNYVVFLESIDEQQRLARGVFIEQRKDATRTVTYAKEAWQEIDPSSGEKSVVLRDGYHYEMAANFGQTKLYKFQATRLLLKPKEIVSVGYRRKAEPTANLAASSETEDIAEFQWRMSTGLTTVLLGLLGIPLSRTAPRRGKSAKIFIGIIIFAVFYNLTAVAKMWVEQGVVDSFPGVWWPHFLLAVLLSILLNPKIFYVQFK
jgi:lipopolysaccharide export system permease protein